MDGADGRTILDYLQYRIETQSPSPVRDQFQIYYNALKRAGAKHRSELP